MQNKQIRLLSRNTHSLMNYPQGKIQLQLKELEPNRAIYFYGSETPHFGHPFQR